MRLPRRIITTTSLLAAPTVVAALDIDCSHVRVDGQSFDLSALSGPHSVYDIQSTPPTSSNTTYTLDICKPLGKVKGVPDKAQCPAGTRVCGIEYVNLEDGKSDLKEVRPIAGNYMHESRWLDPKWSRLKNPDPERDGAYIGLRLEMNGGRYPFTGSGGRPQKALIGFICDKHRTGLEGGEPDRRHGEHGDDEGEEDRSNRNKSLRNLEDNKEKEGDGNGEGHRKSLEFVSYKTEGDDETGVLRLKWRTKYACEGLTEHDPGSKKSSSHWGFFTWFIIIIFMAIATYIIFGSWLNYNRYGARGWDLLPHGDTIRDVPYLMKDWARRVVSTVQGGGSRGGYSAV